MRRVWALVSLVTALVAAAVGGFVTGTSRGQELPPCPEQPAVVLDPGHGGIDGGTNVPGLLEKEIVLDVAMRTKSQLERYHIPVVMTRTSDVDLGGPNTAGRLRRDLNFRARVANHCKAAFFLSIHVNSAGNGRERGMMLFYQPTRPSRDAAYFLEGLLRQRKLHDRREIPIPRKDFAIFRGAKSPAVLVELGFISNGEDRQLLADQSYREQVAQALAVGCSAIYHQWVKNGKQ